MYKNVPSSSFHDSPKLEVIPMPRNNRTAEHPVLWHKEILLSEPQQHAVLWMNLHNVWRRPDKRSTYCEVPLTQGAKQANHVASISIPGVTVRETGPLSWSGSWPHRCVRFVKIRGTVRLRYVHFYVECTSIKSFSFSSQFCFYGQVFSASCPGSNGTACILFSREAGPTGRTYQPLAYRCFSEISLWKSFTNPYFLMQFYPKQISLNSVQIKNCLKLGKKFSVYTIQTKTTEVTFSRSNLLLKSTIISSQNISYCIS